MNDIAAVAIFVYIAYDLSKIWWHPVERQQLIEIREKKRRVVRDISLTCPHCANSLTYNVSIEGGGIVNGGTIRLTPLPLWQQGDRS